MINRLLYFELYPLENQNMTKILRQLFLSLVLSFILILQGCATAVSLKPRLNGADYPLYPATVIDAGFMIESAKGNSKIFPKPNYLVTVAACIDLPFSLIFDTVFLPYDLLSRSPKEQ